MKEIKVKGRGHVAVIHKHTPDDVEATLDGAGLGHFASEELAREAVRRAMFQRHGLVLAPGETYTEAG